MTRRWLDRFLTAAGIVPTRPASPAHVDALTHWRETRAVTPDAVCPACGSVTWNGLHRDGDPRCDASEASS